MIRCITQCKHQLILHTCSFSLDSSAIKHAWQQQSIHQHCQLDNSSSSSIASFGSCFIVYIFILKHTLFIFPILICRYNIVISQVIHIYTYYIVFNLPCRWCEHDPLIIWASVQRCLAAAVAAAQQQTQQDIKVSRPSVTHCAHIHPFSTCAVILNIYFINYIIISSVPVVA